LQITSNVELVNADLDRLKKPLARNIGPSYQSHWVSPMIHKMPKWARVMEVQFFIDKRIPSLRQKRKIVLVLVVLVVDAIASSPGKVKRPRFTLWISRGK
jgi:hypothetical protein